MANSWLEMDEKEKNQYLKRLGWKIERDLGPGAMFLVMVVNNTEEGHESKYSTNINHPTVPQILRDLADAHEKMEGKFKKGDE